LRAESLLFIIAQMYKVYFNNRVIELSGKQNFFSLQPGVRVCNLRGINFKNEWDAFRKDETIKKLCLNGNKDKALAMLLSFFRLIHAGGGLVINAKGEYLLIFRNGKWDLPKGKQEKKEGIRTCALREVEEECGIKGVTILSPLPPTFHIYELKGSIVIKKSHWFMMHYKGKETLVPQKEEGIEKAVWVKKLHIEKLKKNMFPSVIDVVEIIRDKG
jgi:8-oxo-dGTP pyrophosphatase MutT (NUDIX family)